jgi:hypothetical protein
MEVDDIGFYRTLPLMWQLKDFADIIDLNRDIVIHA